MKFSDKVDCVMYLTNDCLLVCKRVEREQGEGLQLCYVIDLSDPSLLTFTKNWEFSIHTRSPCVLGLRFLPIHVVESADTLSLLRESLALQLTDSEIQDSFRASMLEPEEDGHDEEDQSNIISCASTQVISLRGRGRHDSSLGKPTECNISLRTERRRDEWEHKIWMVQNGLHVKPNSR